MAGGSGSGKTTFTNTLVEELGSANVSVIGQDSYYIDQSHNFTACGSINFDHPDALDWELLSGHLEDLRQGRPIHVPIYDYATHQRQDNTILVLPKPYIVVDGILIFAAPKLIDRFDFKIFIDAPEELRFSRRLKRDVGERGRTPEGVRTQFNAHVKPMHDLFVEPSKHKADLIVYGEGSFKERCQGIFKTVL